MRRTGRAALTALSALALLWAMLPAAATMAADGAQVSLGDVSVAEPSNKNGTVAVEVPVSVHGGAAGAITVAWRTVAETAGTADFVAASGSITIPSGAAGGAIPVQIRADRVSEGTETFRVEATSISGATLADAVGRVTIRPSSAGLSIGDVTVTEPDAGLLQVAIPATLGGPPNKAVSFGWQLRSGSGTVGSDVVAASGTGTIPKGEMGTLVRVQVVGDTAVEPDEEVELVVTSVSNTSLADGIGRVTIVNTDVEPPPPPPPPDPFGWQPPAGAVPATGTAVYLESSPGDYVGQGRTYLYTKASSVLTVTTTNGRLDLRIEGDEGWSASFAQASNQSDVQVGYWENLGRYPFHVPGLSFSGEGRGCNTLLGRFIVDEVGYAAGVVQSVTVRFEQRCEVSGPPLRGFLRYDATDPTLPPPPGDAALFPWSPPPGAVPATGNYLYFESTLGDYIGQGQTRLYTEPSAAFVPDWGGNIVQLFTGPAGSYPTWSATFVGRYTQALLEPGLYDDLQRYPFHNPAEGGLSFSGEGRGCNRLAGAFAVDSITWDGVDLAAVEIRFVQRCEVTGPPLYGALRWQRP